MKSIILLIFTIISISATAQEIEVKILNDIFVELIGEEHYLLINWTKYSFLKKKGNRHVREKERNRYCH